MRVIAIILFSLAISFQQAALADDGGVSSSSFDFSDSDWTMRYFQVGGNGHEEYKKGGANFSSYNYVYLKKYLDWERSIRIAFPFRLETPGYDFFDEHNSAYRLTREDFFIGYIDRNLFMMPGDVSAYSEFRFYFGNGIQSEQEGRIGRLRADFILKKKMDHRLYLQSWIKLNYFLQTNTVLEKSFVAEDGRTVTYMDVSKEYWYQIPFDVYYASPDKVTYGLGASLRADNYYKATNQLKDSSLGQGNRERLEGGTDIRVAFGPKVAFNLARQLRLQFNVDYEYLTASRRSASRVENIDLTNDDKIQYAVFLWAGFADLL